MGKAIFGGLTVATNVRYSVDELRKINNMAYLFNPSWDAFGKLRVGSTSLPMALLLVKGQREILQSDVSSDQLILYKGDELEAKDLAESSTPQSVLNVVADNIVNKPKQWQIDAIIPDTYDAIINSPLNPTSGHTLVGEFSRKKLPIGIISGTSNLIGNTLKLLVSLISPIMDIVDADGLNDIIGSINNGSMYNKASLEDMWASRALLKYKPPLEWNYKTVVITNCDISKIPTEDDCHRASITLTEVPIVSTGFYKGILAGIKPEHSMEGSPKAINWLGNQLKWVLNKVGNEPGV